MIHLGDLVLLSFNSDLMEEDKKIKIFDNKVSFKTRQEIYNSAHNSFYKLGWEYAVQKEREPNLFSQWSIEDLSKENILPGIEDCIEETLWFQNKHLENIIINLVKSEDVHYIHAHWDKQIALYYVNLDWKDGWYGETLFYDPLNLQKIDFASSFIPGRILLFDGSIPHTIRPQSIKGPKFRMTLSLIYSKR